MKKLLILFTFLFGHNLVFSQDFNQWIDHNKRYLKIGVKEDGIYRITYDDLKDASLNFNIDIIDPSLIQMFYRGEEIAIIVNVADEDFFSSGDYIEFIGKKNDGALDTQLYDSPNAQTNPYRNLYSNTSYYFLTISLTSTIEGKRIPSLSGNDSGHNTEEFHINTEILHFFSTTSSEYSDKFSKFSVGPLFPKSQIGLTQNSALYSHWTVGKGHTDIPHAGDGTKVDYGIPVENFFFGGVLPNLEFRITGRNNTDHNVDIYVGPTLNNQRLITNLSFEDYENVVYATDLEVIDLNNNENDSIYLSYVINNVSPVQDREEYVSMSAIKLRFAQTFDIEGKTRKLFELNKPAIQPAKIVIENIPSNSRLFDITDETSPVLIESSSSGEDNIMAILPLINSNNNRKLLLESETKSIFSIETVPLSKIEPQDYNYIIITHKSLIDAARDYADYRASTDGGGYNVFFTDIDNLYAQFSYGEVTPLAIRKFAEFMLAEGNPQFMFIIGKSLDLSYDFENNKPASNSWDHKSLIPCFGKPCSDNAFTQGLQGASNLFEPAIPTGRLAARSPQHVINYLNKVKEHENFEYDDLWKKRLLHLSGGRTEFEINRFKSFVNSYAAIAADHYLGGITTTLSKKTTSSTEFIDISEEVNKGVGLITFFGHSSLSLTDIEFGLVSDPFEGFENKGKYPMLIVNGCNAGNIFSLGESVGENWMLTADKGALLYFAHSHLGFATPQNQFTKSVYKFLFSDSTIIYQPIGNVLGEHYKDYMSNLVSNVEKSQINVQQFVLQGDPAIRLYNTPKPDFFIDDDHISVNEGFLSERLTAQSDSFQIKVVISNFGRTTSAPIDVFIRRSFSNGTDTTYGPIEFPTPLYNDTVSVVIHNTEIDKTRGIGINQFEVSIDYQEKIDELNESNNYGQFNFFFPRGAMIFISPKEFSIVNQQPVTFFAQNSDPTAKDRNYIFELDTTRTFDSQYKTQKIVNADIIPKWTTTLISDNEQDSIVYYARVRLNDFTAFDDTLWSETSFLYKSSSPNGWSQSHNEQLRQNNIINLDYDENSRRFKYKIDTINISATTIGFGSGTFDYNIQLNGQDVVRNGQCSNIQEINQDILILIAFDQFTGNPYATQELKVPAIGGGDKGLYCGIGEPGIAAVIDTDLVTSFDALDDFIEGFPNRNPPIEGVKDGDYILLLAAGGFRFDNVKNKIYQFEKFGVLGSNIDNLQNGYPYIAFGRKGDPAGTATEVLPDYTSTIPPNFQRIEGEFSFMVNHRSATMTSPNIGPAKQWSTLYNFHNNQMEEVTSNLSVIGVKNNGKSDLLIDNIIEGQIDLSAIQATQYPYLKLESNMFDSISIPRQIDSWGVIYEEVPEGLLFLDSLTADLNEDISVQEGDSVQYFFNFLNVTSSSFEDQLIVNYTIENLETQVRINYSDTLELLTANNSIKFNTKFSTIGFVGRNKFTANINPVIQPEQIYDNNIIVLNFNVERDDTNPILDVLFDGTHILDGDIVSPNPLITITLSDENNFLIREDTVGLKILLKECPECDFRRVSFQSPNVSYGRSKKNIFQVDYSPQNLKDNTYTLNVVAEDLSGNSSGVEPYEINFSVINESKITHFYPYPNPFSESVRFVFTLTGSIIPNQLKIQIMTVTGRVVREILQDEIGPIKIGNNITQYAWDGKDEFGDQLANGVYLYRVIIKSNGEEFKSLKTPADNLFNRGFGKMYLLR